MTSASVTDRQNVQTRAADAAAEEQSAGPRLRIAYLNTEYPSLSHTFIEREVRGLRRLGHEIHTFSIRTPGPSGTLSPEHRAERERTRYILDRGWRGLLRSLFWAALGGPLRLVKVFLASQRLSPPGLAYRFLHLAYAAEAVRLARLMNASGLHHVHVHMANNGAAVALLAAEFDPGLSYSLTIHGSAEFFNVETLRLKAKAENAVFVRCISHFCRAQVMAWTSPDVWGRFHVVHCGVDPEQYAPAQREQPGDGPLRLLTIGRVHPIKGYHLLLEACRALSDEVLDWTLDLVGDGPELPELRRYAVRLGIADRVVFSGAVGQQDIQQHFDRADLFVLSSFMEGVPVVLMEGMAKGLPVIATRVGGVPELVKDGVSGWLVSPGCAVSLAAALHVAARSRERFETLGEAARETILRRFTVEHVGRGMDELLVQYLAPSMAQPRSASAPDPRDPR